MNVAGAHRRRTGAAWGAWPLVAVLALGVVRPLASQQPDVGAASVQMQGATAVARALVGTVAIRHAPAAVAARTFSDTVVIRPSATTVITFPMPQGDVRAELRRVEGGRVQLRVRLPDATPSWRDGLAVFIDPVGDITPMPGHDDYQLDFHRVLDSSVVKQAAHGTWMPPANDPDWRLGAAREMETWSVRVVEEPGAWVLELRIDEAWLAGTDAGHARLGLLAHDDAPNRWGAWPAPVGKASATGIERVPGWWRAVRLER